MQTDVLAQEYLKNEKIQIYIRLVFVIIASVNIFVFYHEHSGNQYSLSFVLSFPLFVIVFNLFYLLIIKYYPYTFQMQRIVFVVLFDIVITVYVMYLVNVLAAYFAGALLWFSVAYGMRYSKKIAYLAYLGVLVAWSILITTSDFWIENRSFAIGWLLAYIIIPLYYFKLVNKLHSNLISLQNYAKETSHKALHDQLTGLSNRALFDEELLEYIKMYKTKGEKFALFFIDLDFFKEINDLYGHDIGDKVLIEAAKRLQSVISHSYRLGGDEFVSILQYKNENELKNHAEKLMSILAFSCKESNINISASIGIARFPTDATTVYEIKKKQI